MFNTYRKVLVIAGIVFCLISSVFAYSGGNGEPSNPYQIADTNDLLALAGTPADYNKCFILTADIDLDLNLPGGQVFTTAIIAADTNSSDGFQGTAFRGIFDGNGHKIINFIVNGGSNQYLGLFGKIDHIYNGSSVKNLGLENCSVSGSSYVGGLVGYNNGGSISNCYSTGAVSGTSSVGGLVGDNMVGYIRNCYSTGMVSGSSNVGGLVGQNPGSIGNCYSTGTVSGTSYVGGLVGYNDYGSIINCYSTGVVDGNDYVGGLTGLNYDGNISNCYSTGTVSGTSNVGGLVGYSDGGSVVSSFWDVNSSGQTTSAGGEDKTTTEMKTLSTFTSAGWDFVDTWNIGENQTYPFLRKYSIGDLNYDKRVDFTDFALFADHWLEGI